VTASTELILPATAEFVLLPLAILGLIVIGVAALVVRSWSSRRK
jgi:LPXTG-motif cell wall-anchored protein